MLIEININASQRRWARKKEVVLVTGRNIVISESSNTEPTKQYTLVLNATLPILQ